MRRSKGDRYVLVGSMAMAALGIVRSTRDMDFSVSPDPENVGRLEAALRAVFDDPHIEEISSEDLAGDFPAIQYVPPEGATHSTSSPSSAKPSATKISRPAR